MKIVIVGGGFAGLSLARRLVNNKSFDVTLVDKNNYHFFPPLLYQVATAFIEPSNISYPFRRMFQNQDNLRFYMGELINIVVGESKIETSDGHLHYDYLILAMGAKTNYLGLENVKQLALPLKTIDDAINLRNHLLLNAEKAVKSTGAAEKERLQNIVITGGGPTGVEVAGMLAEMRHDIIKKEYPELRDAGGKIYLITSGKALLGPMSVKSQVVAHKVLEKLGVNVKLNAAVKGYTDGKIHLSGGETIPTATVIWAAGVVASEVPGLPEACIGRGRRIIVDACNMVVGTENIFAIGDQCVQTTDRNYPDGHPQLAQVAIQQGKLLAKNLESIALGRSTIPFRYKNKGSMAIITKYKAVADFQQGFLKGYFAWVTWLFIHIIAIAGFRNKIWLAANWCWSFLTSDPVLRLIIRQKK